MILIHNVARITNTQPSGAPNKHYRGVIQVLRDGDNSPLGFISRNSFNHRQLRYQPNLGDALVVEFSLPKGVSVASRIEITAEVSRRIEYFPRMNTNTHLSKLELGSSVQLAQFRPGTRGL